MNLNPEHCRVFACQSVGFLLYNQVMKASLKTQVIQRVSRSRRDVFLTRDFLDLSGMDQVIRALRLAVREGKLVRLGKGIYAKARASSISGRPVLANAAGFQAVAQEALTRLGVNWQPSDAQVAYQQGLSTQIPVNTVVKVRGRFSRKLQFGKNELRLER